MERPVTEYGYLAQTYGSINVKIEALESPAGFYLGTSKDGLPYSRESAEYWPTKAAAQAALKTGSWTQRPAP
jgi:hypothetical protein